MAHIDLECGAAGHVTDGDDEDRSICFSDAEEGSCYSQSYSTADGGISGSESRRASDCSVEIRDEICEIKVEERDCRICHLSLESRNPMESGLVAIELGCSCKDDLGAAHRSCAQTWFKIKGNKTCEICNSIARNVFGANEIESIQQTNETDMVTTNAFSAPVPPSTENRRCLNGHRLVNFLLACMVLAFVISWLFHFKIPS